MTSLRILFISPYLPSLIRVRPYNWIRYLAHNGHQVTLLALTPANEDPSGLDTLREICHRVEQVSLPRWRPFWNALQALPTGLALQAAYSISPEYDAAVQRLINEEGFDVVHVEHLRGAELSRSITTLPIIFDSVDSITLLFEKVLEAGPNLKSRFLAWLDLERTRKYEGRLLERFAHVIMTSPLDRDALLKLAVNPNSERMTVLGNGVDLDYFKPFDLSRESSTVIFTGKMSYHANIAAALDLATKVMPEVWATVSEAKLVIAGKDPAPELVALQSDARITVTGTVPDLRPYLAEATVAVTPIRYGVGIQNKVLEAMAMATPVVSSPQAVSALQLEGDEVLVGETPTEMAAAILKLINDDALRQQTGQAGRRYVETYHDWAVAAQRLAEVYQQAIAAR